jgi:uncharacterized protein (TIGR02444 family)
LQNDFGLDINLLLFCYWYGCSRGIIDERQLQQAISFSSSWKQNVVQPLRDVRKWMKVNAAEFASEQAKTYETLREQIKDKELAAEKYQQQAMEGLTLSSTGLDESSHDSKQLSTAEAALKAGRSNVAKLLLALSSTVVAKTAIEPRLSVINTALYNRLKA